MNEYIETLKSIYANKEKLALKEKASIDAAIKKRSDFVDKYYRIMQSRHLSEREHYCLLKECRNDMLATALKAIYITALDEQSYMTEDQVELAESMVDKYIKENDASTIMARCKNKTYLLSEICRLVEDAAEQEADEIENIGKDDDDEEEKKDDKSDINDAVKDAAEALVKKLQDLGYEVKKKDEAPAEEEKPAEAEDKSDEVSDIEVEEDEPATEDDSKEEDADVEVDSDDDDDDIDVEVDDEDSGEETDVEVEDDSEGDESIDVEVGDDESSSDTEENTDDAMDDALEVDNKKEELPSISDEEKDAKSNLFDELEKSKEVEDAIEVIRSRVADAEQALIKKNAQDKKKVNELLNKIADNVKTIEDIAGKKNVANAEKSNADEVPESAQEKIAKESMMMYKRKINEVSTKRPTTVLEKMTRIVMGDVVKKDSLKNRYLAEDGSFDTERLVDSVKIMYGFLETVNTLQLEKVDETYIKNVLLSMHEK